MNAKLILFSLLTFGCMNEENSSLDMTELDMYKMKDLSATDGKNTNCTGIDKKLKVSWKAQDYYWDCRLNTYCSPKLYANTTFCIPTLQSDRNKDFFIDEKCKSILPFAAVAFSNENEVGVPLQIHYLDYQGSYWRKVAPIDISKVFLYSFNKEMECSPISKSERTIAYVEDSSDVKYYLLEELFQIN